MQANKLIAKNFRTFEYLEIDLVLNKTILITADNRDDEGANSNRGGKSNLVKAMIWCMAGVSQVEDTNDELIRYDQDSCMVSLELTDSKNEYKIERSLKKGTQTFNYWINGVVIAQTNKECEEKWFEDSGINKATFKSSVYLNSVNGTFLTMTPLERFNLLSEWFQLEKYDSAIELCKDKIKDLSKELEFLEKIEKPVDQIDELEVQKQSIKNELSFKNEKLNELSKKQQATGNKRVLDFEIGKINEQLDEAKSQEENRQRKCKLEQYDLAKVHVKIADGKSKLTQCDTAIQNAQNAILIYKKELAENNKQLAHPLTCPNCNAELLFLTYLVPFNAQKVKNNIIELNEKIVKCEKTIKDATDYRLKIEPELDKLVALDEEIQFFSSYVEEPINVPELLKEKEKLLAEFNSITDYSQDIRTLTSDISNLNMQLGVVSAKMEQTKNQLVKYNEAQVEINKKKHELELYQLWGDYRTQKGLLSRIKGLILDKFLINLGTITNLNLKELFKINSKVKLDITKKGVEISQGEHPVTSMSSGEKARVSFSIAFALNKLYPNNLEMLFIDEFFSNLDSEGMTQTLKVLDKIKGQKFVISHVPVECENKIELIRKDGITYAT
jgi:DNA repair exonuclease SbcCD ATPase subunit